jgi:transcriptional regulator with XRE-family HTH domain
MASNTDKDLLVGVGQQIRIIRKKQGMALKDLAQAVGMEPSNLSVIENGKSNPQLLTYVKIASALKCSMANLFDFPFDYENLEQSYTPRKHNV